MALVAWALGVATGCEERIATLFSADICGGLSDCTFCFVPACGQSTAASGEMGAYMCVCGVDWHCYCSEGKTGHGRSLRKTGLPVYATFSIWPIDAACLCSSPL